MFHLKFKHTWHLKWNRSDSMHWTFSKHSGNLCKQKPMLFSWSCISWNSSAMRSLKTTVYLMLAPIMLLGRQLLLSRPLVPLCWRITSLSPFTYVLIHIQAGERKTSRLQTAAIMGYPFLEAGDSQHRTLLLASMGATVTETGLRLPAPTSDCWKENIPHLFQTASKKG